MFLPVKGPIKGNKGITGGGVQNSRINYQTWTHIKVVRCRQLTGKIYMRFCHAKTSEFYMRFCHAKTSEFYIRFCHAKTSEFYIRFCHAKTSEIYIRFCPLFSMSSKIR